MPRMLIASFSQETNMFNPLVTTGDDFRVRKGQDLLGNLSGSGTIVGGILDVAARDGIEIIPVLAANARPGGPVDHHFFQIIVDQILESVERERPGIVLLDLHGAMITTKEHDPEGILLTELRGCLGEDAIIAAGLDLHGHVTDRMLQAASFLMACKENPHVDMFETGAKLTEIALLAAAGKITPVMTVARLPMLMAGNNETCKGPLKGAHDLRREWQMAHPDVLDISIFNCQPYMDVEGMGQTVLAISDGADAFASAAITEIAKHLWEHRAEFAHQLPTLAEGLAIIQSEADRRPFAVADYGDRIFAGAPGDSAAILAALWSSNLPLRATIPIVAPDAVAAAQSAGVGAEVTVSVGGFFTPNFERLTVTGRVRFLGDGVYTLRGPVSAGVTASAGELAVIDVGSDTVIALSKAGNTNDRAFFEYCGIAIEDYDFVVVKSGMHFAPSFAGVATPLKVETPGVSIYRPGHNSLRRAPVYPEVDFPDLRLELLRF